MSKVKASTEASPDEKSVQFVRTVSCLSARGLAIVKRIMMHLKNRPPARGRLRKSKSPAG